MAEMNTGPEGDTTVETKGKTLTKKALETRQRLIRATIQQIEEKGYHNITADEIAKACGMSTGSAYRYFKNKKEMLLAAIEYSFANIQTVSGTEDSRLLQFERMEDMLAYTLNQFYLLHKKYYAIHEEIESLRHIDTDVKTLYDKITEKAVEGLIEKCPEQMQALPHLKERLYVAIGILNHYAHLQMDEDQCRGLDMEQMKKLSIEAAVAVIGG